MRLPDPYKLIINGVENGVLWMSVLPCKWQTEAKLVLSTGILWPMASGQNHIWPFTYTYSYMQVLDYKDTNVDKFVFVDK